MKISGWNRHPVIDASVTSPQTFSSLQTRLATKPFLGVPRGLGRSYGDCSLASQVISSVYLNHLLAFDEATGELHCSAGVSLTQILDIFVPRGWFPPVTPGTRFITIGGAIASDVHGKNHHIDGCFSDHVSFLQLITANGDLITCSRTQEPELFFATCGGMGLTGVIVSAAFKMKPIKSAYIDTVTVKTRNLQDTFEQFETHKGASYSVAWIDCLSSGDKLGRSLLMLGENSLDGGFEAAPKGKIAVPFDMPSFLLNRFTVSAFNALYYHRFQNRVTDAKQHYQPFFYPLDGVANWNRIYSKRGFTQYQFVIPEEAGLKGMAVILQRIADSRRGSFLSVLKAFGERNKNYLSFPMRGYTLALDFKIEPGLFELLDELDRIVLDYNGRVYLTKDVCMSEQTFKRGYPKWRQFQEVRARYGADKVFCSLQSKRLGL